MMAGFIEIVCNIPTSVIGKSMSSNNAKHFDIGVDTLGCGCAKTACGSSRILERMFFVCFSSIASHGGVWKLSSSSLGRIEL